MKKSTRQHCFLFWYAAGFMGVVAMVSSIDKAGAQTAAKSKPDGQVTFTKDVAPILQRACQKCHRPDNMAPMSLLTYRESRPWARAIKAKVITRDMPPWFIDRNVGIRHFKND